VDGVDTDILEELADIDGSKHGYKGQVLIRCLLGE
jgi:hypothetical protein